MDFLKAIFWLIVHLIYTLYEITFLELFWRLKNIRKRSR
jgi:hypothetical protein